MILAPALQRHFQQLLSMSAPQARIEVLSGLTVALALVPEAVAFAFVAGVDPLVGLYAAFMVGLITSVMGGRPGMISGATGALAVVMVSLVAEHGVQYLFATVVLMGIIQIGFGTLRWGKFIRLVPQPVMMGFVNGLAIVIFLAQLEQFQIATPTGEEWLSGPALYTMLALVALAMAIIWLLPRFTKAVPAPLVAIVGVWAVVQLLGIDTRNVGDMASIEGGFPAFAIPTVPLTLETLEIILPYAIILAGIGLIESLLTLNLIDEITETQGRNSRECIAQGCANVVTGFFGGMGGCAMIGQSMINISSGARHRLSGIIAALALLSFILFGSALIEQIPLAALTGVMFMVVIGTFAWRTFQVMRRVPRSDAFLIVVVTGVTVIADLAIAVVVGIILASLVHSWRVSRLVSARTWRSEDDRVKTYHLNGPVMFASTDKFKELFTPKTDPDRVIADFTDSRVWDMSGVDALKSVAQRYVREGKTLEFHGLSPDCARRLGDYTDLVVRDEAHDPKYELAVDRDNPPGAPAAH
ncbi:SulP family inorganic anion transporter [Pontivivens ytuae]|uniref:SulP family inorganic anion transporter n=2 Tax=Pontivivens ytuae TaxID=2789856 RepID=A0A7S9QE96_9RHOB|nr:SulP family inorganic anion transporter [Pontivivens ytuae]